MQAVPKTFDAISRAVADVERQIDDISRAAGEARRTGGTIIRQLDALRGNGILKIEPGCGLDADIEALRTVVAKLGALGL